MKQFYPLRNLRLSRIFFLSVFFSLAVLSANAQCPETLNTSANGFCAYATWVNPPAPLPASFTISGTVFALQSGDGTTTSPALYQSGGGNGACNSSQGGFTGIMVMPTGTCAYSGGSLSNATLPIKLVTFGYKEINSGSLEFRWETASEEDMDAFEIQMSSDGISFTTVAIISATNTPNKYTYILNSILEGKNFFRLKMLENTGKISNSNILQYNSNKQGQSFLRPTVSTTSVVLYSKNNTPGQSVATLYNIQGQSVKQVNILSGATMIEIADLKSGIYILKLATGEALRFVKQ